MRVGLIIITLAATALSPAGVWADQASDAKAVSDEGMALYRGGDFDKAVPLFERAFKLAPDEVRALSVARALDGGGHIAEARRWYHKAAGLAQWQETRAAAKRAIDRLTHQGYVAIDCPKEAVGLWLNGEALKVGPTTGKYLPPGEARLKTQMADGQVIEERLSITAGARLEHHVRRGPSLEAGAPPLALTRYMQGRQRYREGDLKRAAAEFRAGLVVFPESAKLAYNLGRVEERRGQWAPALKAYRHYLEVAKSAKDYEQVRLLAKGLQERLEADYGAVVVSTEPPKAKVFVDDDREDRGLTPLTLRLPAGAHVLRVELAGYHTELKTIELKTKERRALALPMRRDAAAPTPAPAPTSRDHATLAYASLGVGVAGLVAGTVYLLKANQAAADFNKLSEVAKNRRRTATNDELTTDQVIAGGGLGLGGAAVITGTVLLLWTQDAETHAAGPQILLSPRQVGLRVEF